MMLNDDCEQCLVWKNGIIGFEQASSEGLFCVSVQTDFLELGILRNSLLVVDSTQAFDARNINVFLSEDGEVGKKQFKLSRKSLRKLPYLGCVIMSVVKYS
jgi:hypothetical protein